MSDEQDLQETPRAAAAFAEYCALGPARSLRKLAEKQDGTGTKAGQIFKQLGIWSSRYKWQERVKQYDAEVIAERVAKKQAKREEMEDRHAAEAVEEQEWARKILREGKEKGRISLAAVQLLKNSRDDERKALVTEEEIPVFEKNGAVIGIAIYLPQKQSLKGSIDGSSES